MGTERTYFQLRWKTEGDAAAREAAKEEMEVLTVILEHCTANSQDKMAEVELESVDAELATLAIETVPSVEQEASTHADGGMTSQSVPGRKKRTH